MSRHFNAQNTYLVAATIGCLVGGSLLINTFFGVADYPLLLCPLRSRGGQEPGATSSSSPLQLRAIVHYATSTIVPQQNMDEISISLAILRNLAPCNFLVFGLGHDSLMWASLNPGGTTIFLEEDPNWVSSLLRDLGPTLDAHTVRYRTKLSQAEELLQHYRSEPECSPTRTFLRGNERCRLALENLPDEVYEREWDVIMIDAPKGYFDEAPGRMGAIYSAAVMGRNRKRPGVTHVFLHDVDRKVEKQYAEEFLCRKHLVNGAGRLWHFEIPPSVNVSAAAHADPGDRSRFC